MLRADASLSWMNSRRLAHLGLPAGPSLDALREQMLHPDDGHVPPRGPDALLTAVAEALQTPPD